MAETKLFEITLTLMVKAESTEEALGIGDGAAEHLLATFNDDESIDATCGIAVQAKIMDATSEKRKGQKIQ